MALWHCKALWHCGTVVLWYRVSCDRGSGRQNRQKVSRLGVLGARWQAKIVKKSVFWGSRGHFGRRWGLQGPKVSHFGSHLSGQFDFGTFFRSKRHLNGAQRHPNIVKKSHLISDVFFIAFGHQKSAKRTPLLAPKSYFVCENRNLIICDDSAPRLSETHEFEVQGPRT